MVAIACLSVVSTLPIAGPVSTWFCFQGASFTRCPPKKTNSSQGKVQRRLRKGILYAGGVVITESCDAFNETRDLEIKAKVQKQSGTRMQSDLGTLIHTGIYI